MSRHSKRDWEETVPGERLEAVMVREIGMILLFAVVFTATAMGLVLAFLWLAPDEVVRCG